MMDPRIIAILVASTLGLACAGLRAETGGADCPRNSARKMNTDMKRVGMTQWMAVKVSKERPSSSTPPTS